MAQSRPWARAPSAPQHCLALTESRHSPTSWAVQLNTATGGLVLASWPKPSASAPVWQSPVPRSAAEGRGQDQRGTGSGRAPCTGAAPAEAGGCRREMLLGIPWGLLEPAVRVWGKPCCREPHMHWGQGVQPPVQGLWGGGQLGCRQLPKGSQGLSGGCGRCVTALGRAVPPPMGSQRGGRPIGAGGCTAAGRGWGRKRKHWPQRSTAGEPLRPPSAPHPAQPAMAVGHVPPPPCQSLARRLVHRSPTARGHIPPSAEGPRRGAAMTAVR